MENKQWINAQFKRYWIRFFFQTLFIVIFMFLVMLGLTYNHAKSIDVLTAIGATSIAASAFIVFALPSSPVARPHRVFGSYIIGIISGVIWHYINIEVISFGIVSSMMVGCLASGLSAGTTMFFMALLDYEHPPAMGLALGFVMDVWDGQTILVVLIAVIALCALKFLLRNWLINLL